MKRLQTWLLRIFFAATVGFLVPIRELWTSRVWALGILFCCCTVRSRTPLHPSSRHATLRSLARTDQHQSALLNGVVVEALCKESQIGT